MLSCIYQFPKASEWGKSLTKAKIYEKVNPPAKIKKQFVDGIEKITWSHVLATRTINLRKTDYVEDIQIFTINLKNKNLSDDVLLTIDKAIPSPVFFVLKHLNKTQYAACFKRPSEADKSKQVLSRYFRSNWIENTESVIEIPPALDLASLYQSLIESLCPLGKRDSESISALVERFDKLKMMENEAGRLDIKAKKEKQFNRRVELNKSLNKLKLEIENLKKN